MAAQTIPLRDLAAQLEAAAADLTRIAGLEEGCGNDQVSQRMRNAALLDALEALGEARLATEAATKRTVVHAVASNAASLRSIASLAGVAFTTVHRWVQNGTDDKRRSSR